MWLIATTNLSSIGSFDASQAAKVINKMNGADARCDLPALNDSVKGDVPEGTIPEVAKL
jgi:hypothetical protein